jgi:sulfonate transport system permease protein
MSFDERGSVPPVRPPGTQGRRAASLFTWADSFGFSAAGTALSDSRQGRLDLGTVLLGAILPALLLTTWWVAAEFTDVPDFLLPSPAQVVAAAVELAEAGLLYTYIAISIQRVLTGFAIGASIGLVLGALVGLSPLASKLLSPTLGAFRAVPSLAWLPLLVILLGIFEPPKITLIAIGAAFPVFTVVAGALRHVDPHLVEVGRAFGLTRGRLLTTVQLPAVVPAVVSGLRLALVQSWLFLVAAELAGSSIGLGFLLIDSQNNGRMDRLFLAIILLGVLGKTTDALIGIGERALLKRWG